MDTVVTSWWDWSLSNVLSASQTLLTAAGFALAIWQLRRSATATIQSNELLEKLRVRMIGNDILVGLPELQQLEDDLDDSIRGEDPAVIERALRAYARRASEIVGVLESDESLGEAELVKLLKAAVTASTKAKSEIAEGTDRSMRTVTANAMRKIEAANHEASSVRSRIHRKGA